MEKCRRKFRFDLLIILQKSGIQQQSPLRESFINLSWHKYSCKDRKVQLFVSSMEKNKYIHIVKKMKKNKTWGSYLYLITNGDTRRLLY